MVNVHTQEGWIDHDLTIRKRKYGDTEKEYAIGTLTWVTGSKENRKRHKITLFFEDTAQHLMLTAAKAMKLKEHSHVVITGSLRSPAEEKQEDGTWKVPAAPSINVESITFAYGGSTMKSEAKPNEEKTEQYAPTGLNEDAGYEEEAINIGDGSDLPF